jgi:GGDEF domain-containing protein
MDLLTDCLGLKDLSENWFAKSKGLHANPKLLSVDIDSARDWNEKHGMHEGDKIIVAIAHRLRKDLAGCDVCRTGGDEFLAIIPERAGEADSLRVLIESCSQNVTFTNSVRDYSRLSDRVLRVLAQLTTIQRFVDAVDRRCSTQYSSTDSISISCCVTGGIQNWGLDELLEAHQNALDLISRERREGLKVVRGRLTLNAG